VNIEDHSTVQIKMSFPLVFHFLVKAFEESRDFYKSPARGNPLVDDVYQTHLEMSKRQKLRIRSTALLDAYEVDLGAVEGKKGEEEAVSAREEH
jgi:hypothetical protein